MTTIEQLAGITSQHNELVKRVCNGSLDPVTVRRALQDIIEGKLPQALSWNAPIWWRTPEQQLERAHQLWPGIELPEPPKEFTPRTTSEVLLLHVPDTFMSLWSRVEAPTGYTKRRTQDAKANRQNLRLAPNKFEYEEPVWLAFDPEHGMYDRPISLWDDDENNLAASEVFSALIQFPEWPLTWWNGAPAPYLSGYQLQRDGNWSNVPAVARWDEFGKLQLSARRAHGRDGRSASPSVREC